MSYCQHARKIMRADGVLPALSAEVLPGLRATFCRQILTSLFQDVDRRWRKTIGVMANELLAVQ